MSTEKQLHVRYIGIDVIPDGSPFIELKIEMHIVDLETLETTQVISNYGRIYRRIMELDSIPVGSMGDDGLIDNFELTSLVSTAALAWTAMYYGVPINEQGNVVIP